MQIRKIPLDALTVAVLLVIYGNTMTHLTGPMGVALPGNLMITNVIGTSVLVWWAAKKAGLSRDDLGLRLAGFLRSTGWGLLAGTLMSLPALLAFAFPVLLPTPITYRPVMGVSANAFVVKLLFELPIATALCEELAYRGVLQGLFARRLPPWVTIAATSAAFALWHIEVNYRTVLNTNIASTGFVPLAVMLGLAGVFGGGVVFSLLRHKTGSLAGSVLAHWAVDAIMLISLYLRG